MRLGDYSDGQRVINEQGLSMAGSGDHPVKVILVDILGGSVLGAVTAMLAGPFGPLLAVKLTGWRLYAMPDVGCADTAAQGAAVISGARGSVRGATGTSVRVDRDAKRR